MMSIDSSTAAWASVTWLAGLCLGTLPVLHHLIFGYEERRSEVLDYYKRPTIETYFQRYYCKFSDLSPEEQERKFVQLYHRHFGRRTYIFPIVVYVPFLILALTVIVAAAFDVTKLMLPWVANHEQLIAYAAAGAYLWVLTDLLGRYRRRDITPSSLYDAAFRFGLAIPVAITIAAIIAPFATLLDWLTFEHLGKSIVNVISFALGTVSNEVIVRMMRRYLLHKYELRYKKFWDIFSRSGDPDDGREEKYELETLQGVNTSLAERFAEIGITTFQALAYEDPIKLTMRMNLPVRVVSDLISQALLALYLGHLKIYQRYLIRSIQDVSILYDHLHAKDLALQSNAQALLAALARDLNFSPQVLEHMFYEVESDRGARFLRGTAVMQANRTPPEAPGRCPPAPTK